MSPPTLKPLTEDRTTELWALFGPPPVLSSENKEAYYALRNGYVAYYRPANLRHLSWIRELVDTQWEIFRLLRYRTAAIESQHQYRMREWRKTADQIVEKRKEEVRELSPYSDFNFMHERVSNLQTGIARLEARVQEIAQRKPDDATHSRALEQAIKYVERLDRVLKNARVGRNILWKILEYYCRPLDQETEIPAARYDAVNQDEVKQITAPPVVSAMSVTGDITRPSTAGSLSTHTSSKGTEGHE